MNEQDIESVGTDVYRATKAILAKCGSYIDPMDVMLLASSASLAVQAGLEKLANKESEVSMKP